MLELVQKIIFEATGKKGVTMETDFIQDLELNSFDVINIIYAFEEYFHTTIPTRDVWHMRKVGDAIEYMRNRGFNMQ